MSILSDLLTTPVRLLNVPARVLEKVVDPDSELGDEDNVVSKPLEDVARAIEEAIE